MVNNPTHIKKKTKHFSPQSFEHKINKTTIYGKMYTFIQQTKYPEPLASNVTSPQKPHQNDI